MKSTSGRHKESKIWDYFSYDSISDKSRCVVVVRMATDSLAALDVDAGTQFQTCGKLLSVKNPTDLKTHLKTFPKAESG